MKFVNLIFQVLASISRSEVCLIKLAFVDAALKQFWLDHGGFSILLPIIDFNLLFHLVEFFWFPHEEVCAFEAKVDS